MDWQPIETVTAPSREEFDGFMDAVKHLRRAGFDLQPSGIPGLVVVDGRELTIGQVKHLAARAWD